MIDVSALSALVQELAAAHVSVRGRSEQRLKWRARVSDLWRQIAASDAQKADGSLGAPSVWILADTLDDVALPMAVIILLVCEREPQLAHALRAELAKEKEASCLVFEKHVAALARALTARCSVEGMSAQVSQCELLIRLFAVSLEVEVQSTRKASTLRAESKDTGMRRTERLIQAVDPAVELAELYDKRRTLAMNKLREALAAGKPIPNDEELKRIWQ